MSAKSNNRKRKQSLSVRSVSPTMKVYKSNCIKTSVKTTGKKVAPNEQVELSEANVSVIIPNKIKKANPNASNASATNSKMKKNNPVKNTVYNWVTQGKFVGEEEDEPEYAPTDDEINLTDEEDSVPGDILVRMNEMKVEKRPTFKIPMWLQKYFDYEGHIESCNNQRPTILMTCKTCRADESKSSDKIKGSPFFNFYRHLKNWHKIDYEAEFQNGNLGDSRKTKPWTDVGTAAHNSPFESTKWKKPINNSDVFPIDHPIQKKFVRDLVDCVAIDSLPLDFIERPTFIKLIRNLNKNVRLISRRTVGRRLRDYHAEFKRKFKRLVHNIDIGSFHLILDLWTDRLKSSMLGVKAQFVNKNWQLVNTTIGFRHLPGRHTSRSIRNAFDEVITNTFGIEKEKIGFVCGDNASNVIAAFKEIHSSSINRDEIDFDDAEKDDEDDWEDFDDYFEESEVADVEDQRDYSEVLLELSSWTSAPLTKLPCYAHLLQLIVKDSINSCPSVANLVRDAKKLKKFFHSSPYWYDRLKKQAGMGLVNQADTRWNTVYYVFERLNDPKVQEALDIVLKETRDTKKPCKISFSVTDYEKIKVVSKLLAPLTDLTNQLQSDKVTSSLVIPGICFAYNMISEVDVGSDDDLHKFQSKLCANLKERFGSDPPDQSPPVNDNIHEGERSRIFKDSVFKNSNLVVASLLDPRIILNPFRATNTPGDCINSGQCNVNTAKEILEDKLEKLRLVNRIAIPNTDHEYQNQPSCQRKKSLFNHGAECIDENIETHADSDKEIQRYLDLPNENEEINPLDFWRLNEKRFPTLAKLAIIYLGFPASSGSVERLFSIAGALQRSRRASLKWKTLEMLLCYRDMRFRELFER